MTMPYQDALLDQLDPTRQKVQAPGLLAPTENRGPLEVAGDAAPAPAAPAGPDYTKAGQFTSGAYDAGKMQRPWDQQSEKYQIGTVLSHFDPRQGLTPDVINALNGANIRGAKFSGAGDKLNVENAGGWDRFGSGGTADVVQGLKGGNGTWGAWADPNLPQNQGAPSVGMSAPTMGGGLNSLLTGDPTAGINAALAQYSQPSANLRALLEQLGVNDGMA